MTAELQTEADARVWWSAVAEPGDAAAGFLVDQLTAQGAWEWVREAWRDPVTATMAMADRADPPTADAALRATERWRARATTVDVDELKGRAAKAGARIVTPESGEWPAGCDALGQSRPFALWVRGRARLDLVLRRSIAVVGARAATAYGDHVASVIAGGAADAGWTVVSGGAYGIDAAAHRAVLAGGGASVAVMAGGVDRLYPAGNAHVLEHLCERGAVVSEVPPGWAPHRARFLSRNRIIATAGATVVVEAALRSGALNTARHAAALGRPVAAVPGPVTSASSAGCHALVRDGLAVLVTSAAECLELAAAIGDAPADPYPEPQSSRPDFADPRDRQVFDALGSRSRTVDHIGEVVALSPAEVRAALARLELGGLVAAVDGGQWRRVAPRTPSVTTAPQARPPVADPF